MIGNSIETPIRLYYLTFKYNPSNDSWTMYANSYNGEIPGNLPPGVWTGTEVICWSALINVNKIYHFNPQTNTFTGYNATFPYAGRSGYSLISANNRIIVWGGDFQNDGAVYNPISHSWSALAMPANLQSSIPGRKDHSAAWTGTEMIVWGGITGTATCPNGLPSNIYTLTGFRFNPVTGDFNPLSTTNAPLGRYLHSAVWSGSQMIIFGGTYHTSCYIPTALQTGGSFNVTNNTWSSITNAPATRSAHQAFWTGNRMVILGGNSATCMSYNPVLNVWSTSVVPTIPALPQRIVWTGNKFICLTNLGTNQYLEGYAYSTSPVTIMQAPPRREKKVAVWQKN